MDQQPASEPSSQARDELARLRTIMANERTLLAYLRTALMLLVSGATGWKLFGPDPLIVTVSAILGVAGILVLGLGLRRYASLKRMMSAEASSEAA